MEAKSTRTRRLLDSNERRPLEAPEIPAKAPQAASTRRMMWIGISLIATFAAVLTIGMLERSAQRTQLAAEASQTATTPPVVYVVHPGPAGAAEWTIPGTTQAYQAATIYARVSGFLVKRHVDLGDHVKAGQLLAEINSPELEQQLSQARANLQQAIKQLDLQNANLKLAKTTMDSYKSLKDTGAVTQLSIDQAVAGYGVAQANVAAAEANIAANQATVRQYEAMTDFERVLAPFDGVITQRNVDAGALITAGSPVNNTNLAPNAATGAAAGLFEISQIDTLRVFINIPQVVAGNVMVGMDVHVTARGSQNAPVKATVARTANALDPLTRTLLTEIDIPNASSVMMPGQFVYVTIQVKPSGQRWNLPATALIVDSEGTQVMVVDPGGKLRVQKVTVGRDFGDKISIQAGLNGDETIVKQPDVSLQSGQIITPAESE